MHRSVYQRPPRWWGPLLSDRWVRIFRPLRRYYRKRVRKLVEIEIRGLEHLQEALGKGWGVLITPNHAGHSDALAIYHVADRLGCGFYFMVGWQIMDKGTILRQLFYRLHGCFSVDREGMDTTALRAGVEILQERERPLVIFPEGEVYHCNDRLMPFREGPAWIARRAAKGAKRKVVCLPCAIKYFCVDDPTEALEEVMDDVERAVFWRPKRQLSLADRIYRFAEGAIALKEIEYLGSTRKGSVPERLGFLSDHILSQLEARRGKAKQTGQWTDRVKSLRRDAIEDLESAGDGDVKRQQAEEDLDDLFFVTQLMSYPGDYVAQKGTIERMMETVDKFEEDVLGRNINSVHGRSRAVVSFGEAIEVAGKGKGKEEVADLTEQLEQSVQGMIDEIAGSQEVRKVIR